MNASPTPTPRATWRGRLLLALAVAALLSGCTMRAVIDIDVAEDGSGTFQMSMGFDEELRQLIEDSEEEPIDWSDPESYFVEDSPTSFIESLPENATVEPYSDGDFEGVTVSVAFDSLEELEAVMAESQTSGEEAFPFRITTDGNGRFDFVGDGQMFEGAEMSPEEQEMFPPELLRDLYDIQLRVSLPGDVTSTNADETLDGVMVWRIDPMDTDPVAPSATSQVTETTAVIWLIVGAVVIVAGTGLYFLRRREQAPANTVDTADVSAEEPVS